MGVMAFALLGQQLVEGVGLQLSPSMVLMLKEKKFAIIMGAWFVGNTLKNSLLSTGAFEILYNDEVVFSKLQTGSMPSSMDQIVQGILALTKEK